MTDISNCINNCEPTTNGELHFYQSITNKVNVIFDVGCRSDSLFSDFDGTVHYFDPVDSFIQTLKASPTKNKQAYYNNFGLSDKPETLWYYPLFQAFYNRTETCHANDDANKIALQVKDAKSYMIENQIDTIDFLKIDTEGHELKVIQGFGDYIKQVKIIQFEYGGTYIDTKTQLADVINYLIQHDFHNFSYLTGNGTMPLTDYNDHYQYCNIVCYNKNYKDINADAVALGSAGR